MPQNEDELELQEGDLVSVMEKCDDGWFVGMCLIIAFILHYIISPILNPYIHTVYIIELCSGVVCFPFICTQTLMCALGSLCRYIQEDKTVRHFPRKLCESC